MVLSDCKLNYFLCHCLRLLFLIFFSCRLTSCCFFQMVNIKFYDSCGKFPMFFFSYIVVFCSANSSFVGPRVAFVCALGLLLHSCCNHSCICCTNTHTVAFAVVVSLVKRFQLMLVLVLPSLISGH